MKKLLFSLMAISSLSLFSQQLYSFETSEGYTVGNIDGQLGWTTTGTGAGNPNVANQLIVSTDHVGAGSNSLKITKEAAFPPQANAIVGAFKAIGSSVIYNDFVLSFDIKFSEQTPGSSDFEFQTIGAGPTGGVYVIRMAFDPDGTIYAAQTTGASSTFATTTGTWTPNTWFRVKIVGAATGISYFINGTQIYTGNFFQNYNFTDLRFVHNNTSGSAFIDRIAINNEAALSTQDVIKSENMISVYPNPTADFLNIKTDDKVKSILVYDMAGRAIDVKVADKTVDVRNLETGAYLISIETSKGKSTEKFIKK